MSMPIKPGARHRQKPAVPTIEKMIGTMTARPRSMNALLAAASSSPRILTAAGTAAQKGRTRADRTDAEIGRPERPAEQLALRFGTADLSFEVLPDTAKRLNGIATLGFTAKAPVSRGC